MEEDKNELSARPVTDPRLDHTPSFIRVLILNVVGLVLLLGVIWVAVMIWQDVASTEEATRRDLQDTLDRGAERLQTLIKAAEMTSESLERAALTPEVTGKTLRSVLESSLSAFEQRPELSYLSIALPEKGEYGNLERTETGEILLWLFPGTRTEDPYVRSFILTDNGFVPHDEFLSVGYDPRGRPFYQAGLESQTGEVWVPTYQWIIHKGSNKSLWGLSYVKALRDNHGRLIAMLDSDFDLPALNVFLNNLNKSYQAEFNIIELGEMPRLIAGVNVERAPLPLSQELGSLVNFSGEQYLGKTMLEGELRWVAARRIVLTGGLSWVVITSKKAVFINEILRHQLYQMIGMALTIIVGLLLVSIHLSRRFGKPLAALEKRVANISQKNLEVQESDYVSAINEFRETKVLGQALDRMAVTIGQHIKSKEIQAASFALKGAIFDCSYTAIFSLDHQLIVIEWNTAAERMFGLEREHILGKSIKDVVHLHDSADWARILSTTGTDTFQFIGPKGMFEAELRVAAFKRNELEVHTLFINDISERKRYEEKLQESLARFHAVARATGDVIWDWDLVTNTIWWSENFNIMFGYEGVESQHSFDFWVNQLHPDDRDQIVKYIKNISSSNEDFWFSEYRFRRQDGSYANLFDRGYVLRDDTGHGVRMIGAIQDITDRKQSEQQVKRITCFYKALSEINQAIVRMEDKSELFQLVCRCAVEFGGMGMAWIGQFDELSSVVIPVAKYGNRLDYLDNIIVSTDKKYPEGLGPIGVAIRESHPVIVNDFLSSKQTRPWHTKAKDAGWKSIAAFPISRSGNSFAVLCVYHNQLNAFDEEGVALLSELAKDISFALDNFDRETQRKNYEESLRLAASIYETSSEAMMVTDADNKIIAVNPAFTVITGYLEQEVIGRDPNLLSSDRHNESFYQSMWKHIIDSGRWQGEVWDKRKSGEVYPKWLTVNTIFNEDGSVMRRIALFTDISQKKETDEFIWRQANYDSLTGLPNRPMFQDQLEKEIKNSHRNGNVLALMFLDLDFFKEVNDTLGHAKGDMLLKDAAMRLSDCVRATDTVARFGGDEFTIIVNELNDNDSLDQLLQNVLQKLSEPFQLDNEVVYITVSIGITFYPNDGEEMEDLLKNADQAMYSAKAAGRNRFSYFTKSMQELAQSRMKLANDLRSALQDNQLWVAYQPIVDLKSGHTLKAEALIRWQHPNLGLISPIDFIPMAEHTGLIHEIGEFAFLQSAQQVKLWQKTYDSNFQISVNVSPVQFNDKSGNYRPWQQQLNDLGLSGKSIVVEITEGLLLEANTNIQEKLLELRDSEIQVALDDFGTGYSSLSYLRKFDIDYIKIDQSFVQNLAPDSESLALCEAMVVMAHKLHMLVIAEGVETIEQRDLLDKIGCDFAQGYLFSKPLTSSEFDKLLFIEKSKK
jgi:diguanylate cyclase (GGDEF)-like protein/PAS domain S-box-containing protein